MMMIFKIAKTELKNLFYSPVAWFLAIAFLVQCAVFYFLPLVQVAAWQEMALRDMANFVGFGQSQTMVIMTHGNGVFKHALHNLYLFIPLLTMGLISREVNNGTIKLLYSSPVTTREIVVGKYVAMMIYNLVLVSLLGIIFILAGVHIQHTEFGFLFSAALGFYLLVCAYSAIGLYMSSLSNYQIVAAIGTFIIIMVLSNIGGLWQKYDFVRDLTYFLSISGRTDKMLVGLITTKDVLYFLLIVFMFLAFTVIKLRSGRESKSWIVKGARYVGVMVFVLLFGYISSRPGWIGYWDTTSQKINTLHPDIQKVVEKLDQGPLEVTLYVNLLAPMSGRGYPEERNKYLATLWEPYLRFKPDIKFKYVYFYDVDKNNTYYRSMPGKTVKQIAEAVAAGYSQPISLFIPPAEIRKMVDLRFEEHRMVMELKYNGQRTFLRTFNDGIVWPEEGQVAPALNRLLQAKLPKVLFLSGNYQREIFNPGKQHYHNMTVAIGARTALVNYGFDVDSLPLGKEIPMDIAALVLADPKTELNAVTRSHISDYINKGGNMLILGEPGKQDILNPVLDQIGVKLQAGTLIENNKFELANTLKPYAPREITKVITNKMGQLHVDGLNRKDTLSVPDIPGAAAVVQSDSSDFKASPILVTKSWHAWRKMKSMVTDSAAPVFNAADGDSRNESYTILMALSRKVGQKEQRIVVSGDADFLSTGHYKEPFIRDGIFAWFSYGEFPVLTMDDPPKDTLLRLNITSSVAKVHNYIFVFILPALIALTGTIILIRRKRH